MSTATSYLDYVSDSKHMKEYAEYQRRYATQMRESDKAVIDYVRQLLANRLGNHNLPMLLDIGCSTGNLILHLKRLVPDLTLVGGDMATDTIDECKQNPDLDGVQFEVMDATSLKYQQKFDFIVANAILGVLDEEQFDRAICKFGRALRPGGYLIAFDWFHPFLQELTVTEKSRNFPRGLTWRARSYSRVAAALGEAGFLQSQFHPFSISIDLPKPDDFDSIRTYTVRTDDGYRLSFRGAFCQPWSHLIVQVSS